MSEEIKKITEEQLEKVNKQQAELSELLRSLGVLDVQKHNIHQKINDISKVVEETKQELEEQYGKVNINLSDGTYSKIEEEKKGDK
jgi:hypothetical protein|tara:strand:+ start:1378 stop:1635 length:258 start_codon:yes stop_codon:yes gene_type:complete